MLPCELPYRIDASSAPADALDRLVELGALDVENAGGGVAAIMPDAVAPETVASALGVERVTVSAAAVRDSGSVWLLHARPVRAGSLWIMPPEASEEAGALRLADSHAFGTGHHPTTSLCIEMLEETLAAEPVKRVLDVGTGSGILALAALKMGAEEAVGADIDPAALAAAAGNARLNGLSERLRLVSGGAEAVNGVWPLVVANILAAPLMEMAPILVQRVASRGLVLLSGIPQALEAEVRSRYQHLGMRRLGSKARAGWLAMMLRASW